MVYPQPLKAPNTLKVPGVCIYGEELPSPSTSPPFFSYTSESHLEEHMGHLDSYWTLLLEFVIQRSRTRPESLHSSQFPREAEAHCLRTSHPSAPPSLSLLSTRPARQP